MELPDAAALVVIEAMYALGRHGYAPVITDRNGPELMRLGAAMAGQFGIREEGKDDE